MKEDCMAYLEGDAKQSIKCEMAKALMKDGAILYDLRTEKDISAVLPNATKLDLNYAYDHFEEAFGQEKESAIILYCYSGHRACNLKSHLIDNGYTNIHNLGGYESKKEVCEKMK